MNFLSHFYLDRHDTRSEYILGIVTPDLLSIYNPGMRIKAGQMGHLHALPAGADDFVAGLNRHFQVDRIFHSCPRFHEETHHIGQLLEDSFPGGQVQRKFFIAHILLELQLDQVLVRRYATIVQEFYRHFEQLAPYSEARRLTELVSGHPLPNYEHFLEKFTQNRYLNHYREHDHIIYVLGRLLRRVHIDETRFLGSPAFEGLMDAYHDRLEGIYGEFFRDIREAGA